MKQHILLSVFCFLVSISFLAAQNCSGTPANKLLDLRQPLYSTINVVTRSYNTTGTNYAGDVQYIEDVCTNPGNNCDYTGNAFIYDVYYPSGVDYNTCKLPPIFLFHGGAYFECAGYEADQMISLCTEFAKRGFIAFNVEYRRGVVISPDTGYYTAQQMLALYRATQDARGAIRSAIKRERDKSIYNEPYSIDTSHIFIGGMSAGSVTAMGVAYYQQQSMLNKVIPNIQPALGTVNENNYLGDTSISFMLQGDLNLWGGDLLANADTANPAAFFKTNAYMPPMIAFCGQQDSTFNYLQSPLHYVSASAKFPIFNTPLAYETRCINAGDTFRVHSAYPAPDGMILGSNNMYQTVRKLHIPAELYLDSNMQHGLSPSGGINDYDGFGIGTSNTDSILSYIAQRGATFFQAVINGYVNKLKQTRFEDCENYRYANHTANNNACSVAHSNGAYNQVKADPHLLADLKNAQAAVTRITVMPNPVRNILQVHLSNLFYKTAILQISDANGNCLILKKISGSGNNDIFVPVGFLASGMYTAKMILADGVSVVRWMKL